MEVGIRKRAWQRAWRYSAYLWSLRWVYVVKKSRRLVYAVYPRIPPNTPLGYIRKYVILLGGYSRWRPPTKILWGCVPDIPGGVDASATNVASHHNHTHNLIQVNRPTGKVIIIIIITFIQHFTAFSALTLLVGRQEGQSEKFAACTLIFK